MTSSELVLAALYFHEKEYQRVAAAAAEKYYKDFIRKGYTTGGPGEAVQSYKHDAVVKVYIEKSNDMKKPMGQNALWGCPVVLLKAGEERIICFENSSV